MKTNTIYRCKSCKAVKTIKHGESIRDWLQNISMEADKNWCGYSACPICGQKWCFTGYEVTGIKSDHVCDARCTGAIGKRCECSCGGLNHGMAHC